jgi:hypothetical protein
MKAIIFGLLTIAWLLAFWFIPVPPVIYNLPIYVTASVYVIGFFALGNFFVKYAYGWGEGSKHG